MPLNRKIYQKMLDWKAKRAPACALFLKGPRLTGKTELAKRLGREAYRSFVLVSFDKAAHDFYGIRELFADGHPDPDVFCAGLQLITKTRLYPGESLVILDGVEQFPPARQALEVLLKDGRFDYVETGAAAPAEMCPPYESVPIEEHVIEVPPLNFEEWLNATGHEEAFQLIRERRDNLKPFGPALPRLMAAFRMHLLVGGMPEAVAVWSEARDLESVDAAKQRILSFWILDVASRGAGSQLARAFFERIPAELSSPSKRYRLSHLGPHARLREYARQIAWLEDSRMVSLSRKAADPAAPGFVPDGSAFKAHLTDTGLLATLSSPRWPYTDNHLYREALLRGPDAGNGLLLENFTAQCLHAKEGENFFYSERNPVNRASTMEIDFLLKRNGKAVPVVALRRGRDSVKSLKTFKEKFGDAAGDLIALHEGDVRQEDGVLFLPYFMAAVL